MSLPVRGTRALLQRSGSTAAAGGSSGSGEEFAGGLRGFLERLRSGRFFRADHKRENLRLPWEQSRFRYPSPG